METRKHQFSTRVGTSLGDPDAPSATALVMKRPNVSDLWMDGKRDGHQGAIGGACPDPDAATRCLGATWEMAYFPPTCTTCRLHVRLHAMEIGRRRFAAVEGRVRAGCHPHYGLSRRHGAAARGWLAVTHPRGREKALKPLGWLDRLAERIIGGRLGVRGLLRRGRVSPWRTPMRRVEPDRSRARPTGLSDASYQGKPAYPRYNRGAGEGRCPFDPQQTRAPVDCAGGGVAPVPPVTAHRDG